jgi:hypothetical protein
MAPTDQDTALPEAPSQEQSRPPSSSRSMVSAWAGVLTAGAAAAALAVATLTPDHDQPMGRPATTERGSTQGADNSSGSQVQSPACLWTSDVDAPVLPAENLGAAPTPESVLSFEKCGGNWTGRMAWLNPSAPHAGPTCSEQVPVEGAGGGDSGFVNPWAAGNAAAARYLCELGREP